jgi:hypothetical protein
MPSTYTTNGGIELPANGEQSAEIEELKKR